MQKFKPVSSSIVLLGQLPAVVFSRDFNTNLTPQCQAFSRALNNEKLNAPLFPGPRGAVDTNNWCITLKHSNVQFKNLL